MAVANSMNEENLTDDHVSPSLGVSFVMNNASTHLHDDKALCETLLQSLEGLINLENVDVNYFKTAVANRSAEEETVHDSDIPDPNMNIHEFSQEDMHRIIFHSQVANGTGEEYGSCRQARPLNEFDKNDEGLCICFPSVFLFGRAYKQEPWKLTYEQRFHLLNQFTCHAAQDQCLNFFFLVVFPVSSIASLVKKIISGIELYFQFRRRLNCFFMYCTINSTLL